MKLYGLIGYPLSHSFSKKFFAKKFEEEKIADCRYDLFPMERIEELPLLIASNPSLCGLNVTIPHKLNIIPYLNSIDDAAKEIGAVNCISIRKNQLTGYNTDAYGFSESLKPLLHSEHKQALVFGDGGAAQAVKYSLNQLNIPFLVVSRNAAEHTIPYAAVTSTLLSEYQILINTTPLGMSPNLHTCPDIPYQFLSPKHLAYDLVYNPDETLFLNRAKAQGAKIKNGLEMLYLQAERSWHIWNT